MANPTFEGTVHGVVVQTRKALPGKQQGGRPVLVFQSKLPRLRRFVRIGRADHHQIRHRPKSRKVLDRLMRRAIFADTDAVMSENEDGRMFR